MKVGRQIECGFPSGLHSRMNVYRYVEGGAMDNGELTVRLPENNPVTDWSIREGDACPSWVSLACRGTLHSSLYG